MNDEMKEFHWQGFHTFAFERNETDGGLVDIADAPLPSLENIMNFASRIPVSHSLTRNFILPRRAPHVESLAITIIQVLATVFQPTYFEYIRGNEGILIVQDSTGEAVFNFGQGDMCASKASRLQTSMLAGKPYYFISGFERYRNQLIVTEL